eukprot:92682_1
MASKRKAAQDSESDEHADIGPPMPKRAKARQQSPTEERSDSDSGSSSDSSDSEADVGPAMPPAVRNGDSKSDDGDVGPSMPPPKKKAKRALKFQKVYMERLPSAELYEQSYMHRDTVTHVACTKSDFIVTGSKDGVLKFWKKTKGGIEFVKKYLAHQGPISHISVSNDGNYIATCSSDKYIKIFDVTSFDMINFIKVSFTPSVCEWIHQKRSIRGILACADRNSPDIHIFTSDQVEAIHVLQIHRKPVRLIAYNAKYKSVISTDINGMVEYWEASDPYGLPSGVKFKFKSDTDLYEFAKRKTVPVSLTVSPCGELFVTLSLDHIVCLWNFRSGKIMKRYDESPKVYEQKQVKASKCDPEEREKMHVLEAFDYGQRKAREGARLSHLKEDIFTNVPSVIFDCSGNFLLIPSIIGIKVINHRDNRLVRVLGQGESTERFLQLALYQGQVKEVGASVVASMGTDHVMTSGSAINQRNEDPTLICTSFRRQRFYLFTRREPKEEGLEAGTGRDILNEKPTETHDKLTSQSVQKEHIKGAVIHTTMGDIHCKLFGKECPRTVENFVTHSRNGYFDGLKFHRVIKQFMIQTGDPEGDGTGGESIWGGEFEDEFDKSLRHDRPGTISMANAGPDTNGSQFFVSVRACPWLDDKHTVFGRVTKGMDVVNQIENAATDHLDRPHEVIKIINVNVLA